MKRQIITHIYCLVCEHYQAIVQGQPLRQRVFGPAFTDEELITLEICGEYSGFYAEEVLYNDFADH